MISVRTLYSNLPPRLQFAAERVYKSGRSVERLFLSNLIDFGIIPTINYNDMKRASFKQCKYWVYDESESHSFTLPPTVGRNNIVQESLENRVQFNQDRCTIENEGPNILKYTVTSRDSFVAEYPNATVFGPHAMIKTSGRRLPTEVKANIRSMGGSFDAMLHSTLTEYGRLRTTRQVCAKSKKTRQFDIATSILSGRSENPPAYGHWLLEILPRLRGIQHYSKQTGNEPLILVSPNITKWQKEMLNLIGFSEESLKIWNGGSASVQRFVLPIWQKEEWSVSNIAWTKKMIEQNVGYKQHIEKFPRKVLLSRENTQRRRIINRKDIIKELSPLGFETYAPETLTLAEQVALYKKADVLLGASGSAFANIIFSDDVKIIEVFPEKYFSHFFFELANIIEHEYTAMFGKKVSNEIDNKPEKLADIFICPDKIKKVVE